MKNRSLTLTAIFSVFLLLGCSKNGELFDFDKCNTASIMLEFEYLENQKKVQVRAFTRDEYSDCDVTIGPSEVQFFDENDSLIRTQEIGVDGGSIEFTHEFSEKVGIPNGAYTAKWVIGYGGNTTKSLTLKEGSDGGTTDPPQKTIDTLDKRYNFYLLDADGNYVRTIPVTISCTKLYKDTTGILFNSQWTTYTVKLHSNQTYEFKRFFRKECEDQAGNVKIRTHTTSGFTLNSSVNSYQFELDRGVEPISSKTRSLVFGLETYSGYQYEAHIYE